MLSDSFFSRTISTPRWTEPALFESDLSGAIRRMNVPGKIGGIPRRQVSGNFLLGELDRRAAIRLRAGLALPVGLLNDSDRRPRIVRGPEIVLGDVMIERKREDSDDRKQGRQGNDSKAGAAALLVVNNPAHADPKGEDEGNRHRSGGHRAAIPCQADERLERRI